MANRSYYFGIASYNRVDRQNMLLLLNKLGYEKDQILLSVQTKTDYEAYKAKYDDMATILYREGRNCCDNKNTIIDYVVEKLGNTRLVMLSDKVRGVTYKTRKGELKEFNTMYDFDRLIKTAFLFTKKFGAEVFGCYTVSNKLYMRNTISTNQQVLGCFMGIVNPALQKFDPEQPLKEDFEFILRHISNGRRTIRFNDIGLKETLHTTGGSYELWHNIEECRRCNDRILEKYPNLVTRHLSRENEQRYIGETQSFKISITDYL